MSVDPGFGGAELHPESRSASSRGPALLPGSVALEVDGGVDAGNAAELVAAGPNLPWPARRSSPAPRPPPGSRARPRRLTTRSRSAASAGHDRCRTAAADAAAGVYSQPQASECGLRGGVEVPTGGESPRAPREVDQVRSLGRRSESGWEKQGGRWRGPGARCAGVFVRIGRRTVPAEALALAERGRRRRIPTRGSAPWSCADGAVVGRGFHLGPGPAARRVGGAREAGDAGSGATLFVHPRTVLQPPGPHAAVHRRHRGGRRRARRGRHARPQSRRRRAGHRAAACRRHRRRLAGTAEPTRREQLNRPFSPLEHAACRRHAQERRDVSTARSRPPAAMRAGSRREGSRAAVCTRWRRRRCRDGRRRDRAARRSAADRPRRRRRRSGARGRLPAGDLRPLPPARRRGDADDRARRAASSRRAALGGRGVEVVEAGDSRPRARASPLAERGLLDILCEGGPGLAGESARGRPVDRVRVFVAAQWSGAERPTFSPRPPWRRWPPPGISAGIVAWRQRRDDLCVARRTVAPRQEGLGCSPASSKRSGGCALGRGRAAPSSRSKPTSCSDDTRVGDSIMTAGVCLTVTRCGGGFWADASPRRYAAPRWPTARPGDRSTSSGRCHWLTSRRPSGRRTRRRRRHGAAVRRDEIALVVDSGAAGGGLRVSVAQGSIAVDGVSLTLVAVAGDRCGCR